MLTETNFLIAQPHCRVTYLPPIWYGRYRRIYRVLHHQRKWTGKRTVNGRFSRENNDIRFAIRDKKKKAPETASPEDSGSLTVVSSASGTKLLKEIDKAIAGIENKSNNPKNFIGYLAKALGAKSESLSKHRSNSDEIRKKFASATIEPIDHNLNGTETAISEDGSASKGSI